MTGLGWAGTLGGLALCVLIFFSAYVVFDDRGTRVEPRREEVMRLPSVPEADVPRVPLGRPPADASSPAGRVSPPADQVVEDAGDALGGTVDALTPPAPP